MVYYGTESGMWGGDDPCDRKPMVWDDLKYDEARCLDPRLRKPRPADYGPSLTLKLYSTSTPIDGGACGRATRCVAPWRGAGEVTPFDVETQSVALVRQTI